MGRKKTRKKVRVSVCRPKNHLGYTGRTDEHTYVLNRSDVLKDDGKSIFFYRDGVLIYKKEVKGQEELRKFVRLISDYGDTVLKKYFEAVE